MFTVYTPIYREYVSRPGQPVLVVFSREEKMNRLSGTKVTNYHKKRTGNSSGGHGIPKTDTPLIRGEAWQIRNVTLLELREMLESKSGSTAGVNEAVRIVEYAIRQSVSYGTATQEACESAALKCGLDQRGQTRGLGVIKKMLAANPARR